VELAEEFEREFAELRDAVRIELLSRARLLGAFGPALGRPHVDTLNGAKHANIKELRFDADDCVWRVAESGLSAAGAKSWWEIRCAPGSLTAIQAWEVTIEGLRKHVCHARFRGLFELFRQGSAGQSRSARANWSPGRCRSRDLRKALQLTQVDIAKRLKKGQDEISRIENRDDVLLSTLQSDIASIGGELEVICRSKNRPPVRVRAPESAGKSAKSRARLRVTSV
jgi:Phage derived protein Gp49-like (DUF891)